MTTHGNIMFHYYRTITLIYALPFSNNNEPLLYHKNDRLGRYFLVLKTNLLLRHVSACNTYQKIHIHLYPLQPHHLFSATILYIF